MNITHFELLRIFDFGPGIIIGDDRLHTELLQSLEADATFGHTAGVELVGDTQDIVQADGVGEAAADGIIS